MRRIALLVLCVAAVALPAACRGEGGTRESVNIGGLYGWFPDDRKELKAMVDKFLADAGDVKVEGKPVAIIAPHAGFRWSGPTAAFAYKPLVGQKYDRAIVIAPSHHVPTTGGHVGDFDSWSTPLGSIEVDKAACRKLLDSGICRAVPGDIWYTGDGWLLVFFREEALCGLPRLLSL